MSAKIHIITNGIPASRLYGSKKQPNPPDSAMKPLMGSKNGIKPPRQQRIKDAFVAKGEKRKLQPGYSRQLEKTQNAGANVLKGKYWQVMTRKGSKAYPLNVEKLYFDKDARRIMKVYGKRVMRRDYKRVFDRNMNFVMNSKVTFL